MKNNFAQQLLAAKRRGVDDGIKSMAMMATIAVDNVLKDYHEDAERKKILTEFDAEVYRIWQEFKQESINKNEDIGTIIVGWYERILRDDMEDGNG